MSADLPVPGPALRPEALPALTWTGIVDFCQSVLFYGILGLGVVVPIGVALYGALFH